ncbi:hypothetical protein H9I45_15150 [Polaribacter haliotis]|uniref:Phage tail protein n=1 Tax=Polaribacter haliotis TaxID=1888915 RepID=A0A7L8AF65_9FLAO|nr:phage tail tube protein [Polaribacter haliotis]QOD60656.1 hypothetical protein H9I45_15150 [Polaribacter haliotis]
MALDYNGNMRVKAGTKTILHEQESSFSMSVAMQEIATKDIVGKNYNPQDVEWSISGTGIADNSDASAQVDIKALMDALKAKDAVAIEMTDEVVGNLAISGNGYYESISIKATNKEKVTFDFSIKGIGEPAFALNA